MVALLPSLLLTSCGSLVGASSCRYGSASQCLCVYFPLRLCVGMSAPSIRLFVAISVCLWRERLVAATSLPRYLCTFCTSLRSYDCTFCTSASLCLNASASHSLNVYASLCWYVLPSICWCILASLYQLVRAPLCFYVSTSRFLFSLFTSNYDVKWWSISLCRTSNTMFNY